MSRSKLQTELERRLTRDVCTKAYAQSARVLLLRDLSPDLQMGIALQRVRKRDKASQVVDLGVRVPSVESVIEEYEEHRMKAMGFPNAEPVGWLTFWTHVESPAKRSVPSSDAGKIACEFDRLQEEVLSKLKSSREYFHLQLCRSHRPDWAAMPRSAPLLIRTLVCCPSKRSSVDALVHCSSDMEGYESNVYEFMEWLSQRRD